MLLCSLSDSRFWYNVDTIVNSFVNRNDSCCLNVKSKHCFFVVLTVHVKWIYKKIHSGPRLQFAKVRKSLLLKNVVSI